MAIFMDPSAGTIKFANGSVATVDLIVAADGIGVCNFTLSSLLTEEVPIYKTKLNV